MSPDNYVQDPYNTQNFNRFGYVLNNPLLYNDPSGEIIVPILIGAAVAVLTTAIANISAGIPFWHGMGKAAIVRAISGAISFGIGESVTGITSFWAKAGLQAGLHGMKSGMMSAIEGGSFLSGFAAGAISSLVSSGVEALGTDFGGGLKPQLTSSGKEILDYGKNAFGSGSAIKAVMIASGGLSGGISSSIAGGSFWRGVREGVITSGLNHSLHLVVNEVEQRQSLRNRFKNSSIDPDGKPEYTKEYLQKVLNSSIEGLKDYWDESGKPSMKWGNLGHDGLYENGGNTITFGKNISSNYRLVSTMFHEFRHAWQYNSGTLGSWQSKYGYAAEFIKEWDAYNFQMRMGDFDGSVIGWREHYGKKFNNYMIDNKLKWRLDY